MVVDSGSSKAEEIAALHKMRDCAGEGSYLSSLFSSELVATVERRIRDDVSADVLADMLAEIDRNRMFACDLRIEIVDLKRRIEAERRESARRIEELEREAERSSEATDYWLGKFKHASYNLYQVRSLVHELWRLLTKIMAERTQAEEQTERVLAKCARKMLGL
jgi:hypothetical protein